MKQIGVLAMFLFASILMVAQNGTTNEQVVKTKVEQKSSVEKRQAEELAKLAKQLSLTPDQKKSISSLQKNINAATKAFKECDKNDPERKALKKKMTSLKKAYEADLVALLTPKQKKKYDAIKAAEKQAAEKQSENAVKQQTTRSSSGFGEESGNEE